LYRAIAFSPNEKYDPQEFIPERFLDLTQSITDPSLYAFGFGRRICPGKALAENSLFILVASILASLDISKDGTLEPEFELGLVSYPKPYKCRIVPRSDAHRVAVKNRVARSTV